jgi:hypothetical protein
MIDRCLPMDFLLLFCVFSGEHRPGGDPPGPSSPLYGLS